jgi:Ca2+-binding EF-hand superfamily protein
MLGTDMAHPWLGTIDGKTPLEMVVSFMPLVDRDLDARLSFAEIKERSMKASKIRILQQLKANSPDYSQRINAALMSFDMDKDGLLSMDEITYHDPFSKLQDEISQEDQHRHVLSSFVYADLYKDNKLSGEEYLLYKHVLEFPETQWNTLHEFEWLDEEIGGLFAVCDADRDAKLSRAEIMDHFTHFVVQRGNDRGEL